MANKMNQEELNIINTKLDQILDLLKPKNSVLKLVKKTPQELHLIPKLIVCLDDDFKSGYVWFSEQANLDGVLMAITPHVTNTTHYPGSANNKKIVWFDCAHVSGVFKVAYLMGWETDHYLLKDGHKITDPQIIYSCLKNYSGTL